MPLQSQPDDQDSNKRQQDNQESEDEFGFGDIKTWTHLDALSADDIDDIMRSLDAIDGDDGLKKVTPSETKRSEKVTEPELAWSNKVTDDSAKPLSNKVTRRFRRSAVRDQQIIDQIQQYDPASDDFDTVPLVGDCHTPISPIKTATNTTSTAAPTITPIAPRKVSLPVWAHTKDWAKLVMANESLRVLEGSGLRRASWSLNLGPEEEKKALASPKGFGRYIGGNINRLWNELLVKSLCTGSASTRPRRVAFTFTAGCSSLTTSSTRLRRR